MNKVKRIVFALLLAVASFPLSAQEKPEAGNGYIFRFVADKDMFFSPWSGNGKELERLLADIEQNRAAIDAGNMYLCVTSYGTDAGSVQSAEEMAKIRRNRVKSELILRGKVKENHFVTDKSLKDAYKTVDGEQRNIVVVVLPAPVEKVAEIAGEEAAAKVEIYNHEVLGMDIPIVYAKDYAKQLEEKRQAEEQARQKEEQRIATEKAEAERIATEQAEQKRLAEDKAAKERAEQAEQERVTTEQALPKVEAQATPYHLVLRTNLLRWATLTPDLGIEWRINRNVGVLVNGSYTSWSWDDKNRRYALWEVNPEVRWYLSERKAWYVGAMFKAGQFNYKFSEIGRQGDLFGGGITGGYQLKLNKSLSMDFSLGLGYVNADVEKYTIADDVRVRQSRETKHWWGPTQASVTLVWKIGANRAQSRARSNYAKVQPDLFKIF